VEIEHDVRLAGQPELLRDAAADPAVAADDEVVAQVFDRPLPPSLGQHPRQHSAGDDLDDNRTGVRDDRQTGDDEAIERARAPLLDGTVSSRRGSR
jgi:hypothetical protein